MAAQARRCGADASGRVGSAARGAAPGRRAWPVCAAHEPGGGRQRVRPGRDAARGTGRLSSFRPRTGPGRARLDRGAEPRLRALPARPARPLPAPPRSRRDHRRLRQHRARRRQRRPRHDHARAPRRQRLDHRGPQGLDHQRAFRRCHPGYRRHRAGRRNTLALHVRRRRPRDRTAAGDRQPHHPGRRPDRRAAFRPRPRARREPRRRAWRRVRARHVLHQLAAAGPRRHVRRLGRMADRAGRRARAPAPLRRQADRRLPGDPAPDRADGHRRVSGPRGLARGSSRARPDRRLRYPVAPGRAAPDQPRQGDQRRRLLPCLRHRDPGARRGRHGAWGARGEAVPHRAQLRIPAGTTEIQLNAIARGLLRRTA